ncbi:MAG: M67 family metallopeptidase [Acidobacteria bacterium]|nr:M67 family metallopeptidase [Acidobacteriota bacterium]
MSTERTKAAITPRIVPEALDAIRRHASDTYPDECCGALIEREGRIVEAFRLPNSTSAGARRRFQVAPSDYRLSEQRAGAQQGALAGFYHSHPDHPARPSEHDLAEAWPNLTYIIIAVDAGTPGDITAWRLRDDRSAFDRGEL